MLYKVFFVEDEIVTREGIRDNVDWLAHGFEFCGEAPDGEMALPLLHATRPDVLITDIKMPFIDGLQLSRIVRERMPWVKILILSGHDEFEYAQEAIKLGVTEYLLKPVTVHDLHAVLQRLASQLEQERRESEDLQKLRDQVEEHKSSLRQRLLLKLVVGSLTQEEAIAEGHRLGMDLVAACYQVVVARLRPCPPPEQFGYDGYEQAQRIVYGLLEKSPVALMLAKSMEELVLVVKGETSERLEEERELYLGTIRREVEGSRCRLAIGLGSPKGGIADIYQSFIEALVDLQAVGEGEGGAGDAGGRAELLKVDRSAVEGYLKRGVREGFGDFYNAFVQPLGEPALRSSLVRNYLLLDIALAAARFVDELGGDIDQLIPELSDIEARLASIRTAGQIREHAHRVLTGALAFRDGEASRQYAGIARQAREYIDGHYMDPNISLGEVAAQVSLSPSHFSTVFSRETGSTFRGYLTEIRMNKAKELLRTTALQSSEISYRVGYSDPHYFSHVFGKNTGLTPTEFRSQARAE